jgi:hypothetical protein
MLTHPYRNSLLIVTSGDKIVQLRGEKRARSLEDKDFLKNKLYPFVNY